jgi:iron complex outermembrane receptor protein
MGYKDQLILTGELDDVGAQLENSGDSYRFGLELDATIAITDKLLIRPNMTSTNKNKIFFTRDGVLTFRDTNIAYSPDIVGNVITFLPVRNFQISFCLSL